jgi:hypothetical protein
MVRRGDVVQFLSATLEGPVEGRGTKRSVRGEPDHTAVVVDVKGEGVWEVLEQNVGGVKRVMSSVVKVADLVSGELKVFRAMEKDWCPLVAKW